MQVLEGIKVIDLSWTRVGAQATQTMADFGAEVLWLEPPGGSRLRKANGFPFWGRGKQSMVLDLHDPSTHDEFLALIESADVLVETFRPEQMEAWGLGPETLQVRNPRLIHGTISAWGRYGPYKDAPGYEALVMAKLGLLNQFEGMTPYEHPPFVSVPWCSFSGSQILLEGVLAALYEREISGKGQWLETNLVQAFAALDTWAWFIHLINKRWPDAYPSADSYDENGIPQSPLTFMLLIAGTKDGYYLQFAQVAAHLYVAFMKELGLDWMFTDPEWQGIPIFDSSEKNNELWERMLTAAGERTLAEWQEVFDRNPDVFAERFLSGPEVLAHPQLVHDGFVTTIDQPGTGPVLQPGALVKMDKTPAQIGRPAPGVDEHQANLLESWKQSPDPKPPKGETSAPLEGVTVLELAALFAAPYGATMLGDLGARVIKVEPLEGDMIRGIIPFPEAGGAKAMQGKESICIDMTTPEGLAIIHEFARRSDIVLQGFRAGAAERAGVDSATLRAINPDLVYLHAPGYGDGGPYGMRPAYAPSIGAAGGLARANLGDSVVEHPGLSLDEIKVAAHRLSQGATNMNAQADGFAALGVANSMLLGLLARERGAGGQNMMATMISTAAHAMSDQVVDYPGKPGTAVPDEEFWGTGPLYRTYEANDGYVFLAAPQEKEWKRLAASLAPYTDLAGDPRFDAESDRREHADALAECLAGVFSQRGKDEWERDLLVADVGCMSVTTETPEAMMASDWFGRASGYLAPSDHPTFGEHDRIAPAVRFSRSSTKAEGGKLAGAATRDLLAELGYGDAAIEDLIDRKVVGAG